MARLNIGSEFILATNELKRTAHQAFLKTKEHTLHCIIHKHFGYFANVYTIWDINRYALRYGCETEINPNDDWENLTPLEYDQIYGATCIYHNPRFSNIEERARNELNIIRLYSD